MSGQLIMFLRELSVELLLAADRVDSGEFAAPKPGEEMVSTLRLLSMLIEKVARKTLII